jgi:hypothetical protein
MNINAGEHGAQIVDSSPEIRVFGGYLAFGYALDDDSEQLVVR